MICFLFCNILYPAVLLLSGFSCVALLYIQVCIEQTKQLLLRQLLQHLRHNNISYHL